MKDLKDYWNEERVCHALHCTKAELKTLIEKDRRFSSTRIVGKERLWYRGTIKPLIPIGYDKIHGTMSYMFSKNMFHNEPVECRYCPSLQFTAYHEASHTIVALALNIPIQYVTVVYSQGQLGHLQLAEDHPTDLSDRNKIANLIIMYFAGNIGERFYVRRSRKWAFFRKQRKVDFLNMTSADNQYAWQLASLDKEMSDTERIKYLRRLHARSRNVILEHWTEIKKLAAELLVEKTVSAKRAREIMGVNNLKSAC